MTNNQKNLLDRAKSEFKDKVIIKMGRSFYPPKMKSRLCMLMNSGIPVKVIAETFNVCETLVYKWSYKLKTQRKLVKIEPRELKVVSRTTQSVENPPRKSSFRELGRIKFKNGICIELNVNSLNSRMIELLQGSEV